MKQISTDQMGSAPIPALIRTLSSPIMLSLFVQSMYNIVDSFYVSHYSDAGLAALSLAYPVQNLIVAVASGIGVGVNILLSNAFGSRRREGISNLICHSFLLAAAGWLVFLLFSLFLLEPYFSLFHARGGVVDAGVEYLRIIIALSLFSFFDNVCIKVLHALGNTVAPMIYQSTAAVLNVILDPILIWGLGPIPSFGVAGAAIATVFAQMVSAALSLHAVYAARASLCFTLREFRPCPHTLRRLILTGLPSVLGMALVSVYITRLNTILARFSEAAVSALGVYYKVQTFLLIPTYGLNQGVTPVISYNFGAGKLERVWRALRCTLTLSTATLGAGTLLFLLFARQILLFFNADAALLQVGIPALRIISTSFPFFSFTILMPTLFQSTGHPYQSIAITLLRELILLVPLAWLFSQFGLIYTWLTFPVSEIIAAVLSCYYTYALRRGPLSLTRGRSGPADPP